MAYFKYFSLKILGLALLSVMAFGVVGCGNNSDIPSLNEIKTQHYSEDKIERLINRVKRKNLIKEGNEVPEIKDMLGLIDIVKNSFKRMKK